MEDEPVFVVDLREPLEAARGPVEAARLAPGERVAKLAVIDLDGTPRVLPIEPTDDARYLDALARLLRFAVARGQSMREVADSYGGEYERGLMRDGRLPAWVFATPLALGTRGSPALRRALGAED